MLLTPFGAWAAHVVQLGVIGVENPLPQSAPNFDQRHQNSDERVVHLRGHDVVAALNVGFRPLVDEMTLRSVGFLAMSRQTYLVSFVSRLPPAQLSSQRLQMVQAAGLWPRMALNGAEKPVRHFF